MFRSASMLRIIKMKYITQPNFSVVVQDLLFPIAKLGAKRLLFGVKTLSTKNILSCLWRPNMQRLFLVHALVSLRTKTEGVALLVFCSL